MTITTTKSVTRRTESTTRKKKLTYEPHNSGIRNYAITTLTARHTYRLPRLDREEEAVEEKLEVPPRPELGVARGTAAEIQHGEQQVVEQEKRENPDEDLVPREVQHLLVERLCGCVGEGWA